VTEHSDLESWLAAHRDEIAARIGEGLSSVERGDVLTAEQVQEEMRERKKAWIEERRSRKD
jgi:hypothetical protein